MAMKIDITNARTIREIQEDFQKEYPFLRLVFYKPSKAKNPTQAAQIISGDIAIGLIRRIQADNELNIEPDRSVEEIENDFKNIFGLHAEILRRTGNTWIQTSLTRHWSLERQNMEGRQLS